MRRTIIIGLMVLLPSSMQPAAAAAQWAVLDVPDRPEAGELSVEAGRRIYEEHCWYCHGEEGDGRGPIAEYLWPRPRDFQIASFKLRTTPSGELPTDEDLFRSVSLGLPGTGMPEWGSVLTTEERWQVIGYLKSFSDGIFEDEDFDPYQRVIDIPGLPGGAEEALVEAGRKVYEESDCRECHGDAGRGNGPKADELTDDWGLPIRATDLELGWRFRGGSTPRDMYIRLSTGLDGTPMPSYAETLTEEERWQVAHYVASLQRPVTSGGAGPVVIAATRIDGRLPGEPDAAVWREAKEVEIPLTGQATYPPRWQVPSVTDLTVRALHNGEEIVFRVEWNDRSADAEPGDSARARLEGWGADDSYPRLFPDGVRDRGRFRDQLEVLFPATDPAGALPHFVYGDGRRPVRLLRWSAGTPPTFEELRARGPGQAPEAARRDARSPGGRSVWIDGRWTVVLRQPLVSETPFRVGGLVPIAFHVRDGSHGETGLRMSLSSWYFLHLREPMDAAHVLLLILAVLATASVEYALVRFMRRRARLGELRGYGIDPDDIRRSAARRPRR